MIHWLMQILPTSLLFALPLSAPTPMPMQVFGDLQKAGQIVVLLPGMRDDMHDFLRHDFIVAMQPRIDSGELALVTADATLGYYKNKSIVTRLQADVMSQLPANRPLTLVGLSIGGFGALAYARTHPGRVDRLWLLSPFMGEPDFIARVQQEGLQAHATDGDLQRALLANWGFLEQPPTGLKVRLGYGRDDGFAPAYRLLQTRAPGLTQILIPGAHDWDTWLALWRNFMAGDAQP